MKKATSKEAAKVAGTHSNTKPTRPPFKMEIALTEFIRRGIQGLNTLEANAIYGDQPDPTRNRAGTISSFVRYSLLTKEDELRAKALVKHYRKKRGLIPFMWEALA